MQHPHSIRSHSNKNTVPSNPPIAEPGRWAVSGSVLESFQAEASAECHTQRDRRSHRCRPPLRLWAPVGLHPCLASKHRMRTANIANIAFLVCWAPLPSIPATRAASSNALTACSASHGRIRSPKPASHLTKIAEAVALVPIASTLCRLCPSTSLYACWKALTNSNDSTFTSP